jgi:hypothetical protein
LYGETLDIPFKEEQGGYLHTETLKGARTERRDGDFEIARLSTARREQEGAVGSDGHAISFAGGLAGGTDHHAVDAARMTWPDDLVSRGRFLRNGPDFASWRAIATKIG